MKDVFTATSRGQITLPKEWRDQFDTRFYMAEIQDDQLIIKPISVKKSLEEQVEEAWDEYKSGKGDQRKESD